MLVPRFTIRAMLVVMTLLAVFFLLVGTAFRGQNWAWGVAIGVVSLAVAALIHAACFGMVWLFAQRFSPSQTAAGSEWGLSAADLATPIAAPSQPPPFVVTPTRAAAAPQDQEDSA